MQQVSDQIGRPVEGLESPVEFPRLIEHIWSHFVALSSSRGSGFSGPLPITFEQIKAWKELTETPIQPWEVEAIKRVDQEYIRVAHG